VVRRIVLFLFFENRNGSGHTSYQTFGETSTAMDASLLTGELPPQEQHSIPRPGVMILCIDFMTAVICWNTFNQNYFTS
jgi:hypothetical protein